jgi:hypothetical protein
MTTETKIPDLVRDNVVRRVEFGAYLSTAQLGSGRKVTLHAPSALLHT